MAVADEPQNRVLEALLVHEKNSSAPLVLDCWGRPARDSTALGGWKAASYMLGATCLQSLAISGCTVNLVIYLVRVLQQDKASSANTITNWIGTTFISSLIGASFGDAYLGRLWTSIFYQILFVVGSVVFTASSSMMSQGYLESCMSLSCDKMAQPFSQVSFFYLALYMMGLGMASLTPNVVSLGADQLDSPEHKSLFITLHMASTNMGMLVSTSVISYVQNEGHWALGFSFSAGVGIVGFVIFLIGMPSVRQYQITKSPLSKISRTMLATVRYCNGKSSLSDPVHKSPRVDFPTDESIRWLDEAVAERACTAHQVEEVKSICWLLPFWVCGIFLSSVLTQRGTLFVLQGTTMDTRVLGNLEFPPSSMGLFSLTSSVLGAPLYSWVIVPWILRCRKHKKEVSPVERMGVGLLIAIAAMSVAALVERRRLEVAHERVIGDGEGVSEQVPMSIFWLAPQFILDGLTTIFFACGHLDFNYTYSPQGMRSLATAISLSSFALGNYLSSFIVHVVTTYTTWIPNDLNNSHVDYVYWLLVGLLLLTLAIFVPFAKWHTQEISMMEAKLREKESSA